MDGAFLALVVVGIIGKTNILEVKRLEVSFPLLESPGKTCITNSFPKMLFFPKIVYL